MTQASSSESVRVDIRDAIATVTLNRPDKRNAIDFPMLEALIAALELLSKDDACRVVVLAGNGKAFCAGADQAGMVPRGPAEWERIVDRFLDPVRLLARMPRPVIARLHGDTVGGGLGLAMACDFRVASTEARLQAPFIRIGLAGCDMSAGYYLPRLVGLGRATDLMMTGRFVQADEAERMGLVTRTVPPGELDDCVTELALRLKNSSPLALAYTKKAIRRSLDRSMEAEFDYEIFAQVQCLQSHDHREGIAAFRERREARFEGR